MTERRFPILNSVKLTGVVSGVPRVNRNDTTLTVDAVTAVNGDSNGRRVRVTVVTTAKLADACKAKLQSGQEVMIDGTLDKASARGGLRLRANDIQLVNERGFAEVLHTTVSAKPAPANERPKSASAPESRPKSSNSPQPRNSNGRHGRRWNRRRPLQRDNTSTVAKSSGKETPFGIHESETQFDPFLVERDTS